MYGTVFASGGSVTILGYPIASSLITSWAIIAVLALFCFLLTRNLAIKPTGRRQIVAEWIVTSLLNLVTSIMGQEKKARRYLPLLASFFIFILIANLSGMIPGAGLVPGFAAPTTELSVTAGLALVTFLAMFYYGIKARGVGGYFKRLVQPFAVMLPLNLLDELVKPLSLALRLYGSVFADEVILVTIFGLVPYLAPVPFYFIALFFGALQAMVFTMLSAIYLAEVTDEEEVEHELRGQTNG